MNSPRRLRADFMRSFKSRCSNISTRFKAFNQASRKVRRRYKTWIRIINNKYRKLNGKIKVIWKRWHFRPSNQSSSLSCKSKKNLRLSSNVRPKNNLIIARSKRLCVRWLKTKWWPRFANLMRRFNRRNNWCSRRTWKFTVFKLSSNKKNIPRNKL